MCFFFQKAAAVILVCDKFLSDLQIDGLHGCKYLITTNCKIPCERTL